MDQSEQVLQWAVQYLTAYEEASVVNHQKVVQTSYSCVYKIELPKADFYLKQTPVDLFLEPKTLAYLNEQGCRNIPELHAENSTLHCFIMTHCGDDSLRHLFNGHVDINMLKQGILNYKKISVY